VQLNGAQSLWSDRRLKLRQEWRFGHRLPNANAPTESQKPSTDTTKNPVDSKWTLFHELTWAKETFRFTDNNPLQSYFPPFRYSDSATFDSSGMRWQEHGIGLRKLPGRRSGSTWALSTHYVNAQILSDRMQAIPQSVFWMGFAGHWPASSRSRIDWDVREVLHNSQQAKGRWMSLRFARQMGSWTLDLNASRQLRAADWVAERYTGNYTQARQSLDAMGEQSLQLALARGRFKLQMRQKWLTGWVYFDSIGLPQQHAGELGLTQIAYEWSLRKGIFRYDLHHGWQFGQSGPLRLPQWMAHDVISLEKRFSSGFTLSTGLELRMQSRYKGLGYRAEVGQFVVQDTLEAGGYPLVDGFIALKVNQARLYLRMDHLSRGWTAPGGFQIPLYPIYDRALRFGISWDFYR